MAAVNKTPAGWLEEMFDIQAQILGPVPENTGPLMTFKSVMDPGAPMHVQAADYDNPEAWWL
jgi:hypothetical protein